MKKVIIIGAGFAIFPLIQLTIFLLVIYLLLGIKIKSGKYTAHLMSINHIRTPESEPNRVRIMV